METSHPLTSLLSPNQHDSYWYTPPRMRPRQMEPHELAEYTRRVTLYDPLMPMEIYGARSPQSAGSTDGQIRCQTLSQLAGIVHNTRTKYLLRSHLESWVETKEDGELESAADLLGIHLIDDDNVATQEMVKGMFAMLTTIAHNRCRLEQLDQYALRRYLRLNRDVSHMMAAEMRNQRRIQRHFTKELSKEAFAYSPQISELTCGCIGEKWLTHIDLLYLLTEAVLGSAYDYVASNKQLIEALRKLNEDNCPIQEALDCKIAYLKLEESLPPAA